MLDKIIGVYKKIVNGICSVLEIIAAISLIGMMVTVLIHITLRYFFNNAPGWGEELARQFMVVFAFIGFALGVRDKLHISLSVIAEGPLKKILLPLEIFDKFLVFVLGIMMSAFMGPYFIKLKYNRFPGTGIPVSLQYVFPTLVGVVMSLLVLYQIYDHFKFGTDKQQKKLAKNDGLPDKETN